MHCFKAYSAFSSFLMHFSMKYHGVCVKVQNPGYFEEADRLSDRPIGLR